MSRSLLRSVLEFSASCARPPTAAAPALRASTRCLATTASRREAPTTKPPAATTSSSPTTTTTTTGATIPAATSASPSTSGTISSTTEAPAQSVTPPSKPHAKSTETVTIITKTRPQAAQLKLYPRVPQDVSPLKTPESQESVSQLLPLLRAQPAHYIRAHIWGRPYLVTPGDKIRLPFKMPGVVAGDVLRLDRASALGSRDYTLKGAPYVDERLFECRATVLGAETEPLRVKVKTKRRQRRHKNVKSKLRFTVLRISELNVKGPEAVGL